MLLTPNHSLILEHGGKHGGLHAVEQTKLADHVLPRVEFSAVSGITENMRQEVLKFCRRHRVNQVIIRTSHRWDLEGLTDAFKTEKAVHVRDIDGAITRIIASLRDQRLKRFAENERKFIFGEENPVFNPEEVSISIAPYLGDMRIYTVTEHPNSDNFVFVDRLPYKNPEDNNYDHGDELNMAYTFLQENSFTRAGETFASEREENIFSFYKNLKELGIFPDQIAHQFEIGLDDNEKMWFLQNRHFATKSICEDTSSNGSRGRFFGNFPDDNKAKEHPSVEVIPIDRYKGWEDADGKYGNAYILNDDSMFETRIKRTRFFQPFHMLSYFGRNLAISHDHTRFIQYALRKGGLAYLYERKWGNFPLDNTVIQPFIWPTGFSYSEVE